jgi:hypothetical protein
VKRLRRPPLSILLCALGALAGSAPAPAPEVGALLDHHAAAYGFSREQSPAQALHVLADLEGLGLHGQLESWSEPPLRVRTRLELGPLRIESGFDGEKGWIRDRNGAVREAEGRERSGMQLDALIQTGAYVLRRPPLGLERALDLSDSARVELRLRPLLGEELRLYLDPTSHRLIESRWHNGQAEEVTRYLAHEWFGERLLASRIELSQTRDLRLTATLRTAEFAEPRGADFYRMPHVAEFTDVRLGEDGTSGWLPMLGDGKHILLAGSVGELEGRFLLDTGAGSNVLDAQVAAKLGLTGAGLIDAVGVAGAERASFVPVASVRLGEMELTNQSWITLDFGELRKALGDDVLGVLGYDTLSRLVAQIDYRKRVVRFLGRSAFQTPSEAVSLPLRLDLNVPTLRVRIAGKDAWVHVDTGSDNTLDLAAPYVAEHKLLDGQTDLAPANLLGLGGVGISQSGQLRDFVLGPFHYETLTTYFHSGGGGVFEHLDVAGILGAGVLSDYELWFDYAQRTLWLRAAS